MSDRLPDPDPLARCAGPYERWTFSDRLGRPFSFPMIADGIGTHFTALLDRPGDLPDDTGLDLRIPPLWTEVPLVTPFAVHDPKDDEGQDQDAALAAILDRLGPGPYRVNLPVAAETWTGDYDPDVALRDWRAPARPPKAIVGVIDDGIPFAHRAFLRADGTTRLACCWLQAARAEAYANVPFGREVVGPQIDALRRDHGCDESRLYRRAGAVDPDLPELGLTLAHHATHGAHIAGLAAGNAMQTGAEPLPEDVLIVAVQLPNTIAWDTSGFGKETAMLAAVEYVFHRARAIAEICDLPELPLALNFSYGWSASGHDGGTAFETAVEHLLTERRKVQPATALVMPSGNNFEDDMHARIMPRDLATGTYDIGWHLPPDDRTSSYLELWFPPGFDTKGWQVELRPPPGGDIASPVLPIGPDGAGKTTYREIEGTGGVIGQLSADTRRGDRRRVVMALIPTAQSPRARRRTPSGTWTLRLTLGDGAARPTAPVDIWLQRDDDPAQLATGGRQSRLVALTPPTISWKTEVDALSAVRGYGATNAIANSTATTRITGRVQTTGAPAAYGGAAQLSQGDDGALVLTGPVPTVDAVSDQGAFRPGLASIGALSGSGARIVGTSAAAATVTRLMVANMAAGRDMRDGMDRRPQPTDPDPEPDDPLDRARRGLFKAPPVCGAWWPRNDPSRSD